MREWRFVWSWVAGLVTLLLLAGGCTKNDPAPGAEDGDAEPGAEVVLDLWAGVPPLVPEDDDIRAQLEPRPGPAQPETVGEKIELPFPPEDAPVKGPPEAEPGPLVVERFGPVDAQTIVDTIRVAFNRSMIPLADVESLRAKTIPLEIDPKPPGQFKWLGTRALAYVAEGRLPFSTDYKVTVPAGTKSMDGSELAKAVTWNFSTPVLALESVSPANLQSGVALEPTIVITFNQPVQRIPLLAALKLRGGGKTIELEALEPPKPPEGVDPAPAFVESRRVRLKAKTPLKPNTSYSLTLPAGVFGEGPKRGRAIKTSFRTYPPLKLRKPECGDCWAGHGITIPSSTPLNDPTVATKVKVTPEVPELVVSPNYNGIALSGKMTGETTYTIEVEAGITDTFGQTLAKPFKTTVRLGPHYPSLSFLTSFQSPAVIERSFTRSVDLKVAGLRSLEIEGRGLEASEIGTFFNAYARGGGYEWPEGIPASTFSEKLDVSTSRRDPLTHHLDLTELLGGKPAAWFIARSEKYKIYDYEQRSALSTLLSVTDLGVSAALDQDGGYVMVSSLKTGEPVLGADVVFLDYNGKEVWKGTTDPLGIAYASYGTQSNSVMVLAQAGNDLAFTRIDRSDIRGQYVRVGNQEFKSQPRAFFFTDRAPYKPGEKIHLVGVLRRQTAGPEGGIETWLSGITAKYKVTAPRGIDVAEGEVKINAFGTLAVDIETDEEGGTGNYQFQLEVPNLFEGPNRFYHSIPVEAFRAPEFEVEVVRPSSKPLVFDDELVAQVKANYLHGAPLSGGQVSYRLTRSNTGFRPPGDLNEGFSFGGSSTGRPMPFHFRGRPMGPGPLVASGVATTDERGVFELKHKVLEVDPKPETPPKDAKDTRPIAATYTLAADVTDENRQSIHGEASFVVHPSTVYVGLRSNRSVVREGEQVSLEAVVADLAGKRVADRPIKLEVVRQETTRKAVEEKGRWIFKYDTAEEAVDTCSLTSGGTPASCDVGVGKAGTYLIRGTSEDEAGREAFTQMQLYVYGEDAVVWGDATRRVDLVPAKQKWAPGDKATILVRSPFPEARGFVVVEREGISQFIPIVVSGGATAVEVSITEAMVPAVNVSALLVRGRVEVEGAPPGQDLGMPAAASGMAKLEVDDASKRLDVEVRPAADEIEPKGTLKLKIRTKTGDGEAKSAAVAVMVVDEGVLSLMNYGTPDPLGFFHRQRPGGVFLDAQHRYVLPRNNAAPIPPETTVDASLLPTPDASPEPGRFEAEEASDMPVVQSIAPASPSSGDRQNRGPPKPKPALRSRGQAERKSAGKKRSIGRSGNGDVSGYYNGGGEGLLAGKAMAHEVSLRTLFATTAFFDAEVRTDENGVAELEIPMPENLTTFRVMAVAIDPDQKDRFGSGEASVRVRKPLMLRPSLPRFANFGDKFEASVMVDNQTGAAQAVMVGTRGLNVEFTGTTEEIVQIPAGESREVRFPVSALAAGKMKLQFAALCNAGRDATEISLPVHYPATKEAFADYGMTDASISRVIEPPPDALPGYGGMELTMSSTALSGLEDAVQYLVDYEYECAEQTASRILPIFVLGDVLSDFPIATLRDDLRRKSLAQDGIAKLLAQQAYDGGFGYWKRDRSWPYLTNWVTFALLEGKRAGFDVEEAALNNALQYIENFVRHGYVSEWGRYYDHTSRAFGLWLLSREKRGSDLFDGVWAKRDEMPLYARILLMSAAHRYGRTGKRDEILEDLRKRVVEGARTIHFKEGTTEADSDGLRVLMHSNVQTDAIALMALTEVAPTDPMLPKIIAGILSGRDPRQGGRWATTHANAWALLSAARYYDVVEADEPDYVARLWLDQAFAGEQKFVGRSMAKVTQHVPMSALLGAKKRDLILAKEGPGKLYYRLGLNYAREDLTVKAEDQGFFVYRTYEALPGPDGKLDESAVKRNDDGEWQIKAGTNLKVTINITARDRANYVVVDDALPAGFEGQNPRFVTSVGAAPAATVDPGRLRRRWWFPYWSFSHTEMRDDRMLLFADRLPAGVYTYSYTARATSIGTFVLPPIKAEAMYEPERFGHSSSSVVRVVE